MFPTPIQNYSLKINIGSRIIFITVPNPAIIIGNFISPSPANIDLKNPEKTIKGKPITIVDK